MANVIIAGDLHLYHDGTEEEAIDRFVDTLRESPPDVLVLGGDIYELWRRDLSGATWMTSDFTDAMVDLREQGAEVVYLAGNHDEYLMYHLSADERYPFEPVLDYRTEVDGERLFITHGHKYEPAYNPITNDVLALSDDHAGRVADWVWRNRPAPNNVIERTASMLVGPAASFFDPEDIRTNSLRRRAVRSGVEAETPEGVWGIYGHTHVPFVDRENMLANWGSMTAGQSTYLQIADGEVELREI